MKYGFVVSPSDLTKVQQSIIPQLTGEQIVCSSAREVEELKGADVVCFVISEMSMCSTAYQELVLVTLDTIEKTSCRVLRLDNTEIPLGFHVLQSLSEAIPG